MVSLTYHDEHVAWQQRVQKEINESFKSHSKSPANAFKDLPRPCFSPPKPRNIHSSSGQKPRSKSNLYSNLPSANLNLGALNVYAEVRGKYSRNANKTLNSFPQVAGLVSRPSTSGSLQGYSRKDQATEVKKPKEVLDSPKRARPLAHEARVQFALGPKVRESNDDTQKNELQLPIKDSLVNIQVKDEENHEASQENCLNEFNDYDSPEKKGQNETDEKEEDLDRRTEDSLKTTSSKLRYIEELEKLLKLERIRRIQAEEKLQKISSSHRGKDFN